MKNYSQYILAAIFCIIAFSCNNDFLLEETDVTTTAVTEFLISPEWGTDDYSFYVPMAGNAKFSVIKTPGWLHVNTMSGQFVNDIATINCSASVHSDFSEIGIYMDLILLDIEGKGKSLVPVSYITEGNPVIETEKSITISYDYGYYNNVPLVIKNGGQGILLWSIAEMPEEILIDELSYFPHPLSYFVFTIPPNGEIALHLLFNSEFIDLNNLDKKIVIVSNDKNNRETVIDIHYDLGNPSLNCYDNQLNFERTETMQLLDFSNDGNGLLTWKIESCPEWLSVSETSGILFPYSWETISFTCNRSLMPNGQNSQIIYLKTNDKNNPSYAITVTVIN